MEVKAYKDLSGALHESKEEQEEADFDINIEKIVRAMDGDLENTYPDNYSIVSGVLSTLLNTGIRLSKANIQKMINYCEERVSYD